jgi:hypothetical protein
MAGRLVAMKFIKRFPVSEGRKIVEQLIAKAREINADETISHRITELCLFGSVLTGNDDDDAGDVDMAITMGYRRLPEGELAKIQSAEQNRAPRRLNFLGRMGWSIRESEKKLVGISHRVSLHGYSDLVKTGTTFATVYKFDVEADQEVECDKRWCRFDVDDNDATGLQSTSTDDDPKMQFIVPSYRERPPLPNELGAVEHCDASQLLFAQHMWSRGASVLRIGELLNLPPAAVQAYLATPAIAGGKAAAADSLRTTADATLPLHRHYDTEVSVAVSPSGSSSCKVFLSDPVTGEDIAGYHKGNGAEASFSGRTDLFLQCEHVATAVLVWIGKCRTRVKGLKLEARTTIPAQAPPTVSDGAPMPDMRPLMAAMMKALRSQLPVPRDLYVAQNWVVEVRFGATLQIAVGDGGRGHWNRSLEGLQPDREEELWQHARAVNEMLPTACRMDETLTVFVSGSQLPNKGDFDEDIDPEGFFASLRRDREARRVSA